MDFDAQEVADLFKSVGGSHHSSRSSTPQLHGSSQPPEPTEEGAAAAAKGNGVGSSSARSSPWLPEMPEITEEDMFNVDMNGLGQLIAGAHSDIPDDTCKSCEDSRGSSLEEQMRDARAGLANDSKDFYSPLCKGAALEGFTTPCDPRFQQRGKGKNLKDHTCNNHNHQIEIPIERVRQMLYEDGHEGEHGQLKKAATGAEWTNSGHNDKGKKRSDKNDSRDASVWAKAQTTDAHDPVHYRVVNYYARTRRSKGHGAVPAFIVFQQQRMASLADASCIQDKPEVGSYYWKLVEEKYVHTREDGTDRKSVV